jgi:hypothetical protein
MVSEFIKSPKTRPVRSKAAAYAIELQDIALRDCRAETTPVHIRAALMRAWVDLQEMRLRLAMKPAPKPIDVSTLHPKPKRTAGMPKAVAVAASPAVGSAPIAPEPGT